MSAALPFSRSGGFGLPCAVGAPMPPGPRRAPHSNRAGFHRPVGSVVTVSDVGGPVPHSRRSHGALVVRRFPAADTPLVGVSPKDLAAPVPTGAVLSSGRLFYQHSRLRRQAQSGCALAYAFLFFLPKHFDQPSTRIVSHGGLTECGQSRGWAAQ